ncbi:MAG: DUF1349 domain-containing protein [Planctomycetota bacterium]
MHKLTAILTLCLVLPLLYGCTKKQTEVEPDQATTKVDLSSWGEINDPERDSKIVVDDDALSIQMGVGRRSMEVERGESLNSPFVSQRFDDDFSMKVSVDGNLPMPKDAKGNVYISAGLLLKQDEQNYIRIERATFSQRGKAKYYVNFEQRVDGKLLRRGKPTDLTIQEDESVDLRFEVKGDKVRAVVRLKDKPWHEMGIAKLNDKSEIQAGVSAVKTDNETATVIFRKFKVKTEFVPVNAESSSGIILNAN